MTATLSLTETTRLNLQKLDTASGLPPLPHIPKSLDDGLTPEQQEANLLHVALWIVEHDRDNFDMGAWHQALDKLGIISTTGARAFNECGTVHCIAGFAQVMAGEVGFSVSSSYAGFTLLGREAYSHFFVSNPEGLEFLKEVIARNSVPVAS